MSDKRDVFDRLMSWRLLRPLYPLYARHKEVLLYLLFGGLTMVVSMSSYWVCCEPLGMNVLVANAVSWLSAVSFAYVTNRLWVFAQKACGLRGVLGEMGRFFAGRVATLGMEEAILWLFVEQLHCNSMLVKLVAQVLVVLANYVISKLLVFRKGDKTDES